MKRITIFGLVTLAVTATLLLAARGWDDSRNIDPHSHENIPFAVVKKDSGVTNSQFGELVDLDAPDRYLMVVNADCDSAVTDSGRIYLWLCPGPGKYQIKRARTSGSSLDWITIGTYTADTLTGEISFNFKLGRGEGALLHIVPQTLSPSHAVTLNYKKATWDVNGRKIAVDPFDRIHICYTDSASCKFSVWYARSDNGGSTWQKQRVDTNACYPTIAVDNFGVPYIAYRTSQSNINQRKVIIWSEGKRDTLMDYPDNQVSLCIEPSRDVGMVHAERQAGEIYAVQFSLHILKNYDEYDWFGGSHSIDGPSSCFTDSGDVVCIHRLDCGEHPHLSEWIYKHLPITRGWIDGSDVFYSAYPGNHYEPNLSRQIGQLWATFIDGSDIKQRKASLQKAYNNKYTFSHPPSTIISNANATTLQMANGFPFLVMEKYSQGVPKIYYSYRGMAPPDTTWITPQRVTQSASGVYERYPHVAIDEKNDKIYIIWTQWGEGITTGIGIEDTTDDSLPGWNLYFTRPAGGEMWRIKQRQTIIWHCDIDNVKAARVYLRYNPSGTLYNINILSTGDPPDTTLSWIVGSRSPWPPSGGKPARPALLDYRTSDSCQMFIKVWPSTDTSQTPLGTAFSNFFTIIGKWIYVDPNMVSAAGGYLTAGGNNSLPWEGQNYHSLDTVVLQFSEDAGESFTSLAGGLPSDSTFMDTVYYDNDTFYLYEYNGSISWTVPSEPTSDSRLRLMAVDTTADTFYSNVIGPFMIPPPGGFKYNTYSNQEIMSLNDDRDKIGLVYTAQDPDDATKLSVIYMESDEGLGFSAPDTVGQGCWPSFSEGACFWQSAHDPAVHLSDTLFYAYQLNDTFATPYPLSTIPLWADSGGFAPVGFTSVNDTVHAIIRTKLATHEHLGDFITRYYSLLTLYAKFPESFPGICLMDTLQQTTSTSPADYGIGDYAASVVKRDSVIYCAYNDAFNCYFATITPSGNTTTTIGQGSQPSVSCSEGNITYTYLGSGDTTLIRLWRYLDDTTWVERDTFYLNDDAEILCGEEGLMYGVQRSDTSLANLYVYDPISEEYYLTKTYTGYYPHPYIDDKLNELSWITTYSDQVDYETYHLTTDRRGLNVLLPALYQEADDKRSPYTLYRDTCIHYTSVDVDSAADSLIYRFPHLNSREDYAVIVEFYTECDSTTQLQLTVGLTVDTIQIPGNSFSWYETDISSGADTLNLAIRRISQFGFVPVSRVIVRRRSSEGFFMSMGGPQSDGPAKIPFCLYQPFPNPFSNAAMIRYSLPYATHVSLKIYDVSGRLVTKLVDEEVAPGVHTLQWRGKDDVNRRCASGIYFVRFEAADYQASKKMVLVK